jgi:hypothetical protein
LPWPNKKNFEIQQQTNPTRGTEALAFASLVGFPSSILKISFIYSYAGDIDQGIREYIRGHKLNILAMGIGLAKIKTKGLYADLHYHSGEVQK